MRHSGLPDLVDEVMKETIPMRGRMIHGRDLTGELYEQSQQYDIENRVSFSFSLPVLSDFEKGYSGCG